MGASSPTAPGPGGPAAAGPAGPPLAQPGDTPARLREALPVFLSHPSPWILAAALAAALGLRAGAGPLGPWDAVPVVAVVAAWPLLEWMLHVAVLHYEPMKVAGRVLDWEVPIKHRAHHRDPWRTDLVFIPVRSYLVSLPLAVGLWWGLVPSPLCWTGLAATFALALHYEAVHFAVHTRLAPRGAYYRRLWRNHRLHHFKNERCWYGVTRLAADGWLGTAPDPDAVPASPTARALPGDVPEAE